MIMDSRCIVLLIAFWVGAVIAAPPPRTSTECGDGNECTSDTFSDSTEIIENVSTKNPGTTDTLEESTMHPQFTTLDESISVESVVKADSELLNIDKNSTDEFIASDHESVSSTREEQQDTNRVSDAPPQDDGLGNTGSATEGDEHEIAELKEELEIHDKPISLISAEDDHDALPKTEVTESEETRTSNEMASTTIETEPANSGTSVLATSTEETENTSSKEELNMKMSDYSSSEDTSTTSQDIQNSKATSVSEKEDDGQTLATTTESKSLLLNADDRIDEDITESSSEKASTADSASDDDTSSDIEVPEESDIEAPEKSDIEAPEKSDIEGYAADSPSLESANVEERENKDKLSVTTEVDDSTRSSTTETFDETEDYQTVHKYISGSNLDLVAAVQFLHYHDKESSEQCNKLVSAHWDYATNLTEENKQQQLVQTLEYQKFCKEAWENATSFAWKSFNDTVLRRWFKGLSILGDAVLSEDKLKELNELKAEMKSIYSTAKVCSYKNPEDPINENSLEDSEECDLSLEPDLTRIMAKSNDYDELLHAWKSWRDAAGAPIRDKYLKFVEISNEAARMNGFRDTGELWRESYESETFQADLQELWEQLRPLYENLHAYVRRKLISHYGPDKIKEDGPIPAHLLGNMWAQSWVSLMDRAQPFPGKPSLDITPTMEARNMTALEMFRVSEEFFTSLGLKAMPDRFWNYSLIEKPKDREVICHASAWDFCNGQDFRIKQCTDVTMEDLITVHHEMGHIQYFLQYAKQPNVFREGANPGFHEAIGDVLALSVSTPMHLKSIGLLEDVADDPEGDLNFLMSSAFDKVAFLPYGYLIDMWRWGLFSGDIPKEQMNSNWWELRLKYQGICPPVARTENDFDPGAKYHIPGNTPYIRYFVSHVIQFQMHKALCDASGHVGPLHKCDIYQSQAAGQILSQVMELGSSEHWSEVMKVMTGGATDKMDARPILEYFDPLIQYLKQQNQNETLGWKSDNPLQCP